MISSRNDLHVDHRTDTQNDVQFQTWVCRASTHNSVLGGVTDEITGLLLVLGDVTLERLDLSCQVRLIMFNRTVSSTAIATLLRI